MSKTGIRTKHKDWAKSPAALMIGLKLREGRLLRNLSANDLSEDLGFTDETYNRIENGRGSCSLYRLMDLAEYFGLEVRLVPKEASDAKIKA